MTITDSDLAKWKALCDAATDPPWNGYRTGITRSARWVVGNNPDLNGYIMSAEDAAFIAASRTAVPRLISEVESLRAQREAALGALGMHPDSDSINLADEIARIRDEGRDHFHSYTRLLDKVESLRAALTHIIKNGDAWSAKEAKRAMGEVTEA